MEKQKVKLWAKAVQKKASLVKFTKKLFEKIKLGETKKAELFAEATKELSKGSDLSINQDISFILKNCWSPSSRANNPFFFKDVDAKVIIFL